MGKETEGSSNGAERYRSSRRRCGTLKKKTRTANLAVKLTAEGVVEVPAVPGDYRLRAGNYPELVAATELPLVPLEFRHHAARPDITRSG